MSQKSWILTAAILGSGIVFLDSTVVNVALPQIGRDLPSTSLGVLEGQSYVYYGYLLSLSALLILAGALADFYGRRRLFLIGMIGFGVTSVMCGIAPNLEMLIVARFLQGAAGAILVPGSLAILTASFEGEEQGHRVRRLGGSVWGHDDPGAGRRRRPGGECLVASRLPHQRPAGVGRDMGDRAPRSGITR